MAERPHLIVGIGASAGGFKALTGLFERVPVDCGIGFVVVQHLDPNHPTALPELLATSSKLPVVQAVDGIRVAANHVYTIPPNATLTIERGLLRVAKPLERRGQRMPIDDFFRSLARDQGDDSVCIILSGSGTDGTLGLKAIKESGGIALAQTAATAEYDSMPLSGIATQLVDQVQPVEEMPALLVGYARRRAEWKAGLAARSVHPAPAEGIKAICRILHAETGHDFSAYKKSTVLRRIQRRMLVQQVDSIDDYAESLGQDPREVRQLLQDLLINVTHFFRDPDAFAVLARTAIPAMAKDRDGTQRLRVWVPACASGEEAYSVAILMREHLASLEAPPRLQIFASDIDEAAIEFARQGRYPESIAEHVSPERLQRFFSRHGATYQTAKEIRDPVVFSLHDLIKDPPFSRLDLICCRNFLIYVEPELQRELVRLFHHLLLPHGFLFLGPSESLGGYASHFDTIDGTHRIFQRRAAAISSPLTFPLAQLSHRSPHLTPIDQKGIKGYERVLLDDYAPACVIINEAGEILHFSGRTGRYLELPVGAPSLDVFSLAKRGLRGHLRTAIHEAQKKHQEVACKNLTFEDDGRVLCFDLVVRPLATQGDDPELLMVVFDDHELRAGRVSAPPEHGAVAEPPAVLELERELKALREHLQATIEVLETTNEELQSANEELRSANEELQTSKEEMQSINEEMHVVNAELNKKADEQSRTYSDLQNLFQSTRIATLFLDRDLRIKSFTPFASNVFRLVPTDVGRPITDILPLFPSEGLFADIAAVLANPGTKEREIRLTGRRVIYFTRIGPYLDMDGRVDGVVVTFTDISELKQAQHELARHAEIVDSAQLAIISQSLDDQITSWNTGAESLYGWKAAEAIGQSAAIVVPPDRTREMPRLVQRVMKGERVEQLETMRMHRNGTPIAVSLSVSPLHDDQGTITGVSMIAHEISEYQRMQQSLLDTAGAVAHDFNNLLTGILGNANLLRERMAQDPTAGRHVAEIETTVQQAGDLCRQMLAYSGKGHFVVERVDLSQLAAQVGRNLESSKPRHVTLRTELADALPAVNADVTQIQQILTNLITNACESITAPAGTVKVVTSALHVDEAQLARTLWGADLPAGEYVCLEVSDDGCGMTSEVQARIFDPFFTSKATGRGLGLAAVKGIVRGHHGTLRVVSQPDRGSSFRLFLPAVAGKARRVEAATRAGDWHASGLVLVVDDEPVVRSVLAKLLQALGFEVLLAASGREAIAAFKKDGHRVAAVLLDLTMPVMDGEQVLRELRQLQPDVCVLIMSGYDERETMKRFAGQGCVGFLAKPFRSDDLRTALRGMLESASRKKPATRVLDQSS